MSQKQNSQSCILRGREPNGELSELDRLFEEIRTTPDPLENANIWEVKINPGEPQHGHLEYEYHGSDTALLVWKGDAEIANNLYSNVRRAVNAFARGCAEFYEMRYCNRHEVYRADIRLRKVLTRPQKYQIARGIETQGYTIKVSKY